DRSALDRLQRSLIERQKEVEAHEEELAVRRQALARTAKSGLPPPITEKPGELRDAGQQADESLVAPTTKRFADRVSTGTPRLDDLLMGGMPPKGHVLLIGEPFVGKEIVLYAFAADGLRKGESAVLITCARGPDEIRQHMVDVLPSFAEFEKKGRVQWIDASRPAEEGAPAASSKGTVVVKGPDDHPGILSALVAAVKKAETNDGGKVRVGFLGLSAALSHADEKAGFTFLQNFVGILKPRSALAFYTVEGGTLTEAQIERLMSRMDGAIRFKQEQNKTYLSVAGIGDVATRDWIECRSTGRALIVGSFSLERIR
ncbi:MAG TPA: RAD55 family ATPase, partial [Thermoplasmata archaeon]|nr:RAD55 family ATPase [Thermoplasmata archaeon]